MLRYRNAQHRDHASPQGIAIANRLATSAHPSGPKENASVVNTEGDYSLRFSIVFPSFTYRDASTDHSSSDVRMNLIPSAVPYPRSKAAAETSQLLNSLVFHRLGAALHRQYKMYSSRPPSIVGRKYDPSSYGLRETTYRVKHF